MGRYRSCSSIDEPPLGADRFEVPLLWDRLDEKSLMSDYQSVSVWPHGELTI